MARRAELTFIDLPVTDLLEENPLPMFSSARDRTFRDGGLLPVERDGLGENTGFRILPYRLQDRYAPHAQRRAVSAAVLENDRLRAAFLPEYGGRLYSLWDKRRERECLYINPDSTAQSRASKRLVLRRRGVEFRPFRPHLSYLRKGVLRSLYR